MDHLQKIIASLQAEHFAVFSAPSLDRNAALSLERRVHGALNVYPDEPALVYTLATLCSQTDRSGAGINLYRRAIELGLDGPDAWNNLAACYKVEHKDASAAECYQTALDQCSKTEALNAARLIEGKEPTVPWCNLKASKAAALHGMASLYVNAGQPEKIIAWADEALKIDPRDRYALWNRGLGYLESGRWREGWEAYDVAGFMRGDGFKPIERKEKTYGGLPKWEGPADWQNRYGGIRGDESEKPLVICYGEQGIGDELMFASMLPDLMRDARVIIDCDPRLEALFRRSFPEAVAIYPTSDRDAAYPWIADHQVDAWVPMGSLGRYYRDDAAAFPRTPYIKADESVAARWRNTLGPTDKLRVGISWCGGLKKTRMDQRSFALRDWSEILAIPGVEWISFQYHRQAAQEVADVGRSLGVPIHHWQDVIDNYDTTAAVLQSMDLVITVCTSLVHLCGSLGVETWCLAPRMVAWRYQCEGPNPFYDSVQMIRQEKSGEWGPALATVRDTLLKMVAKQEAA